MLIQGTSPEAVGHNYNMLKMLLDNETFEAFDEFHNNVLPSSEDLMLKTMLMTFFHEGTQFQKKKEMAEAL